MEEYGDSKLKSRCHGSHMWDVCQSVLHRIWPTAYKVKGAHTVLSATRHKCTCPALTPARQARTRFTYSSGMKGRVDLVGWLRDEVVYLPADRQPSK